MRMFRMSMLFALRKIQVYFQEKQLRNYLGDTKSNVDILQPIKTYTLIDLFANYVTWPGSLALVSYEPITFSA